MTRLEKIANQLLCDIEGVPTLDRVTQVDVKLSAIQDAILSYHHEELSKSMPYEAELLESFEIFWKAYGKKVGRTPALKKWKKLKRVDVDKILATVEEFVLVHPEVQFRPHPVTYINQRRWEDELPSQRKSAVSNRRPAKENTWQVS